MNFKSQLEEAAGNHAYDNESNVEAAFIEGAKWAIQSKLVGMLVEALTKIDDASWVECERCKNSSEYAYEIARDMLAAFEQAKKELE